MDGEAGTLITILEWGWLALVAVLGWAIRKMVFLDAKIAVIEAESKLRDQHRGEIVSAMKEHNSVMQTQHADVLSRISSIDDYLRNGRRGT